jgi:hypothetical protein
LHQGRLQPLRRLDRLGRAGARTQRDLELLSEAFAVWTKVWFAHTPALADDAKRPARMGTENRYRQFVDHVAEQFSGRKRFLDDLPRESLVEDTELAAQAHHLPAASPAPVDQADPKGSPLNPECIPRHGPRCPPRPEV